MQPVAKYNENHDEHGRFASGGSGGAASKIVARVHAAGGFTYNVKAGRFRTTGYAVSPYKEHERIVADDHTLRDSITQYRKDKADILAKPGHHLGAWRNEGKVYLDISIVSPTAAGARKIAEQHDQLAYFDLNKGVTVDVAKKFTATGPEAGAAAKAGASGDDPGQRLGQGFRGVPRPVRAQAGAEKEMKTTLGALLLAALKW